MKIIKNPEIRNLIVITIILTVLLIIAALIMSLISAKYIRESLFASHAAIIGVVTEEYPDSEQDVIRQVLERDEDAVQKGQALLSRYGIYADDLLLDIDSISRNSQLNLMMYLLLAVIACGMFTWVMIRFQIRRCRQIDAITNYARRINKGDYSLDIRDNNEGDISLLKNEVYKITTMLKEQAEILKHDKIALADSLADISHQIKTPLTSLFVLSDLLSNQPAEDRKMEFLERMKAQLQRIEWLINALLTLSKLDAGAITMKKETINVQALVNNTLETISIPMDIKMITVDVSGKQDVQFQGDFKWAGEALLNIIKNCVEHTPEKGRINISFAENPLYTMITISDTGSGIAPEDLPYIFNRFYKGKNAGDDSIGIGLAMAWAIIDRQGGDITVSSKLESGTEFTIKFYK